MSETAAAPTPTTTGGGEAASAAPTEGTAPTTTTSAPETAPTTETAAPDPHAAERAAQNRKAIEAEKARRRAQREREAKERDLSEKEKSLGSREQEIAERVKRADQFDAAIAEAKRNPGKFLEATGLTIDDLVRWKLNDGEVSPDLMVKDVEERSAKEIKSIREEIEALKKEREAEQQAQARAKGEQAIAQFHHNIHEHISANPDQYDFIRAGGDAEVHEVFKLIEGRYRQTNGEVALSVAEACDMIEKFHEERASTLAGTKKGRALWERLNAATSTEAATKQAAPAAAKTPDARAKASSSGSAPSQLTNATVTSPASPTEDAQPLEDRDLFLARTKERLRQAAKELAAAKAK